MFFVAYYGVGMYLSNNGYFAESETYSTSFGSVTGTVLAFAVKILISLVTAAVFGGKAWVPIIVAVFGWFKGFHNDAFGPEPKVPGGAPKFYKREGETLVPVYEDLVPKPKVVEPSIVGDALKVIEKTDEQKLKDGLLSGIALAAAAGDKEQADKYFAMLGGIKKE